MNKTVIEQLQQEKNNTQSLIVILRDHLKDDLPEEVLPIVEICKQYLIGNYTFLENTINEFNAAMPTSTTLRINELPKLPTIKKV